MSHPSTVKKIMDNWIEKSESENHAFNKYIALWIAFNAYYSSETNKNSDWESIEIIKTNDYLKKWYLTIENSNEVSDLLSLSPVINMKKNTAVIIKDNKDFASIIATLYQIRNNLFHGNKDDRVERDIEVVTKALPILKQLVVYCQSNFDKINF